jgi:DNA repair protein RadC
MKPLAKSLLKKFGSFAEVIHAPEARLREVDGVGDVTVTQLKLIASAASRIAKGELKQRAMLSSWNDVIAYCRTSMVSEDNIVFAHLGTNASNSDESLKLQIPKVFAIGRVILAHPHFPGQIVFTPIFGAR